MLENRSFDHLLGFSGLEGTDPAGRPTKVDGLTGSESNVSPSGLAVPVSQPADYVSDYGPGHEFKDVREQLCGRGGAYSAQAPPPGQTDPNITNGGYVTNFSLHTRKDPGAVMRCFSPSQLPVLTSLAREFAVCDRWFSSLPGPTWPNRYFIHAASSGGLDDSPSFSRQFRSVLTDGFKFENGTIYDRLDGAGRGWAIYSDDEFPQALSIAGMRARFEEGFRPFKQLRADLSDPGFSRSYVFIEPDYHAFTGKFRGGNSQHPMDDMTSGERFLKDAYEAIRSSPVWEKSLLIVNYDEHGGFYDHVVPPATVHPGDSITSPGNDHNGFNFQQLGVRVPAVIVSPFVARGTIDHTEYDHTSALASVEKLFGLKPLTRRDAGANDVNHLLSLRTPRTDAPATLPEPAASGYVHREEQRNSVWSRTSELLERLTHLIAPRSVDPSLQGFHHVALLRDLQDSPEGKIEGKASRFLGRENRQAVGYMWRVREKKTRSARRPEQDDGGKKP